MNYNYSNLTGSVLLRADSHSQKTEIDTGNSKKVLIDEYQFWGTEKHDGLYYDYESSDNTFGYTVSCEGWNDYTDKPTERMNLSQTKEWINNKILQYNEKSLCVIQGYAGCGKTTFVHSILRKIPEQGNGLGYYNFYIGHVKNSSENKFIYTSIMTQLILQITTSLQMLNGMKIYKKFMELFQLDVSRLSPILETYFAPIFYNENDASLYRCAQDIYDNRGTVDINKYITKYRVQFKQSYMVKEGEIKRDRASLRENNYSDSSIEILLFVDYIWRCAVYLTEDKSSNYNQIIVYDNLDIIDDIYIVADFIDGIRSVLANYEAFRNLQDLKLPMFKGIIVVRKITYAAISRFVEVGSNETNQKPSDVDFLDISNLYVPTEVLKHKAKVLISNINEYIPENAICRNSVVSFLKEVLRIPNEIFLNIKFSELLNHNMRACTNMIEQVIKNNSYEKYFLGDSVEMAHISAKCKASVWIHIICTILKEKKVLDSLGYNLSNSQKLNEPTTLSRLILTYLCNRRLGCMRDIRGFTSVDVSFKEMVESLEKIPFDVFNRQDDWDMDIIPKLENNYSKKNIHEQIVFNIGKMLQRNNAMEEIELWRRPIYYTRNAFSLLDFSSIKTTLLNQINNFNTENSKDTSFCITDEGYAFIERIATHFEFYSVRYNNHVKEPICCVLESDKLDQLIEKVYKQVSICAKKQVWLMKFYTEKHNVSKSMYLEEWFHPRTENFEPQLHIVRTIYDHINYLEDYREYLCDTYKNDFGKVSSLNYCLVKWIGMYLQLYKEYFYDELTNTQGEHNNIVWLDLKYLYWLVVRADKKRGIDFVYEQDNKIILINRNKSTIFRDKQNNEEYGRQYNITNQELLDDPMLLE